jgi:hypothetical protein
MTMQSYKGYFIEGSALLVHPFSPDWYVGGSVLMQGRHSSIVEITRFQLQQFTVSMKELAEWFGLEIARLAVDECLRHQASLKKSHDVADNQFESYREKRTAKSEESAY